MSCASVQSDDFAAIEARREALRAQLAAFDERLKAVEQAVRDTGWPVLIAELKRVKIAAIDKAYARAIARAIGDHGGSTVAKHLASIPTG